MKDNKQAQKKLELSDIKQLAIIGVVVAGLLGWVLGFIIGNRHGIETQKEQTIFMELDEHDHE